MSILSWKVTNSLPPDQKISIKRLVIVGTYSNGEGVGIRAYLPLKGKSRRGITPRKPVTCEEDRQEIRKIL